MTATFENPLLNLPKFGKGVGLHRVRYLLDRIGIQRDDIAERCIVVTGSNGKGSTSRISSELMRLHNWDVGLFTSPHLYRYNERIQINSIPVSDQELVQAADEVLEAVKEFESTRDDIVGAFEAQFVTAIKCFQARNVRWMVLEAGIGGRYDPVRLVRSPVAGLVSLDYEHTELLGRTLPEIAFDKIDAARRGGTVFLGESCIPFKAEITTYAELTDIKVEFVGPDTWTNRGYSEGWQHFDLVDGDLQLPSQKSRLVGRHQINNHAIAIRLCRERLHRSGLWPVSQLSEQWRDAISRVTWPGRLEIINESPRIVVDVGHTPEGVKTALAGFFEMGGKKTDILVTGGSKNKDVGQMLKILAPQFNRIICTAAHHNGLSAEEVYGFVREINPAATAKICQHIEEAVSTAIADAADFGSKVYVAGGLFLAAEFSEGARGGDPAKIRFF
jgi:dihydrofolate synthase/folylpolyglutamate synthase